MPLKEIVRVIFREDQKKNLFFFELKNPYLVIWFSGWLRSSLPIKFKRYEAPVIGWAEK